MEWSGAKGRGGEHGGAGGAASERAGGPGRIEEIKGRGE